VLGGVFVDAHREKKKKGTSKSEDAQVYINTKGLNIKQ
jgi:hypothetical protein